MFFFNNCYQKIKKKSYENEKKVNIFRLKATLKRLWRFILLWQSIRFVLNTRRIAIIEVLEVATLLQIGTICEDGALVGLSTCTCKPTHVNHKSYMWVSEQKYIFVWEERNAHLFGMKGSCNTNVKHWARNFVTLLWTNDV